MTRQMTYRRHLDSQSPLPRGSMPLRVRRRGLRVVNEVAFADRFEEFSGQLLRLAEVLGHRERLLDQVARVTAAQRNAARAIEAIEQAFDEAVVVMQVALDTTTFKDVVKLVDGRAFCQDLVTNPAKERL